MTGDHDRPGEVGSHLCLGLLLASWAEQAMGQHEMLDPCMPGEEADVGRRKVLGRHVVDHGRARGYAVRLHLAEDEVGIR